MFLVNSRLGHFSAPTSLWDPFSRSYGVNLPSSLAVIHSSTLGSSPHPPVSVYGTGRLSLHDTRAFLAGMVTCSVRSRMVTCSVRSPEGSRYCRVSVALHPSTRYSVSARQCHSPVTLCPERRAAEY